MAIEMDKVLCDIVESELIDFKSEDVQLGFSCTLRARLSSDDDAINWMNEFKIRTATEWITKLKPSTSEGKYAQFVVNKDYVCHHSSYRKLSTSVKNYKCGASISIRIKKNTLMVRKRDEFVKRGLYAIIKIDNRHTHQLNNAEALRWLRRRDETRSVFWEYFNQGKCPSVARMFHQDLLIAEVTDQVADSSVNPPEKWVYRLHNKWRSENFGDVTSSLDMKRAALERKIRLEADGHRILFSEEPFVISVVTPLMQRAVLASTEEQVFFLDSSASCDQTNTSITVFLIATKVGAVCVGVSLHQDQSETSYTLVLNHMKELWCGVRGSMDNLVCVFMTDDSTAMKNGLRTVFPDTPQLLCLFHIAQAMWRWLSDGKNGVTKDARQYRMREFSELIYTRNADAALVKYQELIDAEEDDSRLRKRLSELWSRRAEWCMAYRNSIITRGHNTNNYSEASFRVLKDIILSRLRAYNSIALLDFVVVVMESYYAQRMLSAAFGRHDKSRQMYNNQLRKASEFLGKSPQAVRQNNESTFTVESFSIPGTSYDVCSIVGVCSCPDGQQGQFCKHQAAVLLTHEIEFTNSTYLSAEYKQSLYYIAKGTRHPNASFFEPMSVMPFSDNSASSTLLSRSDAVAVASGVENMETNIAPEAENCDVEESARVAEVEKLRARTTEQGKRLLELLTQSSSDSTMLRAWGNIVSDLEKITTTGQLYSLGMTHRLASFRRQVKIKVQPTSISRRRDGSTRGSARQRPGRPLSGVIRRREQKKCRNLRLAIAENRANAKSHGHAH